MLSLGTASCLPLKKPPSQNEQTQGRWPSQSLCHYDKHHGENQTGQERVNLSYHLKSTTKGIQGRDSRQELEPETTAAHCLLTCVIFSWFSSYSVQVYSSWFELDSTLRIISQDITTYIWPQTDLMESVLQLGNPSSQVTLVCCSSTFKTTPVHHKSYLRFETGKPGWQMYILKYGSGPGQREAWKKKGKPFSLVRSSGAVQAPNWTQQFRNLRGELKHDFFY